MVLNYPSLKCVLQHLEPNRRFQLASRCPSLQKTEKSTPLHIDNLEFRDWGVVVNDVTYRILSIPEDIRKWAKPIQDTVMLPGDVLIRDATEYTDAENLTVEIPEGPRFKEFLQITFESEFGTVTRKVANFDGLNPSHFIKKMLNVLFGDRKFEIDVKNLNFKLRHEEILRVPENFKIRTRNLDSGISSYTLLCPILATTNIKVHTVDMGERSSLSPCRNAEKVVLLESKPFYIPVTYNSILEDNTMKRKELRNAQTYPGDALAVVRNWVENGRSLGAEFVFDDFHRHFMVRVMVELKRRYGAFEVKMKKKDERCLLFLRPITIPLSPISEILIVGIHNPLTGNNQLKLEVVKIGETSRISKNYLLAFSEFAEYYFYIYALFFILRFLFCCVV